MGKKVVLILLLVGLLVLVGCEEGTPALNLGPLAAENWVQIDTHWEDGAGNSFAYVYDSDADDAHIDIHVNVGSDNLICYIDEFDYENGEVTGTYTYFDNDPNGSTLQGPFEVTMEFSYSSNVLTITYTGTGASGDILNNVTMGLNPTT